MLKPSFKLYWMLEAFQASHELNFIDFILLNAGQYTHMQASGHHKPSMRTIFN